MVGPIFRSSGLLRKDARLSSILKGALDIVLIALVAAIGIFVYVRLFDRLKIYDGFNDALLVFVCFALLVLDVLSITGKLQTAFFAKDSERSILLALPVSLQSIIVGKGLHIWLYSLALVFVTVVPVGMAFGFLSGLSIGFFFEVAFFGLLFSVFALGASFLLIVPASWLILWAKDRPLVGLIVSVGLAFALSYVYSLFLRLFISLISNASLSGLFTTERMASITKVSKWLYPSYLLVLSQSKDMALAASLIAVALSASSLALGALAFHFYYRHWLYSDGFGPRKYSFRENALSSQRGALLHKEFALLFFHENGLLSYFPALCVMPFLSYLVVSSLNAIFSIGNLTYFASLFPGLYLAIDSLILVLFVIFLNGSSSASLSYEKGTFAILKAIPVSFKRQMAAKLLAPFSLGEASYLTSLLILVGYGEISWVSFGWLLLIGTLVLLTMMLGSMEGQIVRKWTESQFVFFVSVLSFAFIVGSSLLTFVSPFKAFASLSFYGFLALGELVLFLPFLALFLVKGEKDFRKMEAPTV